MKKRYDNLILKGLRYFVENPYTEVYLREYGRKLKISPNTAQRFLDLFVRENLVEDFKRGNLRYFKANMNSIVFRQIKIVFSLKEIEDCGIINRIRNVGVTSLMLFGSVAEGKDDGNSDIDFVVISSSKNKVLGLIREVEKRIGREINVHCFSWVDWKKQAKQNKAFYQDVIIKGINLIGETPVVY